MCLEYGNINVNSEFLNLTKAMAFTKIIKHPVQLQACWKHAAGTLQVKHAPYVMHFLSNKYVNLDVNSLFLNLTNAMAITKILKHPVHLQAFCRYVNINVN